jgi:hypothetical protein
VTAKSNPEVKTMAAYADLCLSLAKICPTGTLVPSYVSQAVLACCTDPQPDGVVRTCNFNAASGWSDAMLGKQAGALIRRIFVKFRDCLSYHKYMCVVENKAS